MKSKLFKIFLTVVSSAVFLLIAIGSIDEEKTGDKEKTTQRVSSGETSSSRVNAAKKFTAVAKKNGFKAIFSVDPNDDSTLVIKRETSLGPQEIQNWTTYLYSVETSPEDLKKLGFNKVRIYTTASKNIQDYALKLL